MFISPIADAIEQRFARTSRGRTGGPACGTRVVAPADLRRGDPESASGKWVRVSAEHGTLSGLVLSHAHDVESGIFDTSAASFDAHVAVNARASLLLIAAFARQAAERGGAIVAFTSDHTTGNLPYGASKGALDRIVISAARELGPMGISANVVNPGPIDTGWMDAEMRDGMIPHHPLGRIGTPADIAAVTAFLLSEEGRWVSGQLLNTDGGFSARY